MFRLALAFVLGLNIVSSASAQQESQEKRFFTYQSCDNAVRMTNLVMNKYGEQALFQGTGLQFHLSGQPYTSSMMFFVNQDTGSWSLISLYPDGTSCMVANGRDFTPWMGKKLDKEPIGTPN